MSDLAWLLSEKPSELVHVLDVLTLEQLRWLQRQVGPVPAGEKSEANDLRKVIVRECMQRISKVA